MQIETTYEADVQCKELIGEAYELAYVEDRSISNLWEKVQEALKFDMCTTGVEDTKAMDLLGEVFEEACRAANQDGYPTCADEYVDYLQLWEKLCAILEVNV